MHLDLPALATEDQDIPLANGFTYRRKRGDLLHPERESRETLDRIKAQIGRSPRRTCFANRSRWLDRILNCAAMLSACRRWSAWVICKHSASLGGRPLYSRKRTTPRGSFRPQVSEAAGRCLDPSPFTAVGKPRHDVRQRGATDAPHGLTAPQTAAPNK